MTGNGKILLMDDDEDLRRLAKSRLARQGFEVETAASGEEAISAYKVAMDNDVPFDVVVLDMVVDGGMGGKRTMARLLELDPAVSAIASSGYVNEPTMATFWESGFKGVLAKPYLTADLERAVRAAMKEAAS